MSESTVSAVKSASSVRVRAALATGAGNFMEWFDFGVYGFVAASIGRTFFPSQSATASLLSSLAVFGVSFFFRPLGGVIFGAVGDRFGRRPALATEIVFMGATTTLIALLPSPEMIGIAAPILLVALRCLQGVSVGGEWTGSSAFLVEHSPPGRRGLYGSTISATSALGALGGGLVGLVLTLSLSAESIDAWGWRLPFLIAAPITVVGFYLRLRLGETPVYSRLQQQGRTQRSPLRSLGRRNLRPIGLVLAFASVMGVGYYYLATFAVTYLSSTAGFSRVTSLLVASVGLAIYTALCPLAGLLSDHIGRRLTLLYGCGGMVVIGFPAFLLIGSGSIAGALVGLAAVSVCQAMVNVIGVVVLVELFPPAVRASGSSIGYNLGLALFGGPAPFIATALVARTGLSVAPAFYLCAVSLIAFAVLFRFLPETYRFSLDDGGAGAVAPSAGEPSRAESTTTGEKTL